MPRGTCILCSKEADLQLSHILPAFAFRWMRESSGNGHIRLGMQPNQRVQDGPKRYWMCSECEGRLNWSETLFSRELFYPYLAASGKPFRYSRWLIHFCVSLSWRVLRFYRDEIGLKDWDMEALTRVDQAEIAWRDLLLGKRQHPGSFQQHMLPLDRIESVTGNMAPNINRYLTRAIDMDICRGGKAIFTYAKLGRFIVLGFVHEPNPHHWRGTKVHGNEGILEPKKYVLPKPFGDYLNHKAKRMAQLLDSVSDKQHAKIDTAFRQGASRFVGSDAFQAMLADIAMFGDEAFSKREQAIEDER